MAPPENPASEEQQQQPSDWSPTLPRRATTEWCLGLERALVAASRGRPEALPATLPAADAAALLNRCAAVLEGEPTLLRVAPPQGARVVVVGDLHGQFHDLLQM